MQRQHQSPFGADDSDKVGAEESVELLAADTVWNEALACAPQELLPSIQKRLDAFQLQPGDS